MGVDDYNGDNFDHGGLGFIGGGYVACWTTNGRPIETHPTPKGTLKWRAKWKQAVAKNYLTTTSIATHGAVMSHRTNYLDLDPTYRNVHGRPLLRMTFDYTDNEHRMSDYLTDRAADIAQAMRQGQIHRQAGAQGGSHRRRLREARRLGERSRAPRLGDGQQGIGWRQKVRFWPRP